MNRKPSISSPFDAVVFAGGGCRCFWQAGFWSVAAPALGIEPRVVAGVSAGSAFACAALAGDGERALREFKTLIARNPRNLHLGNAFRARPLFPHERIYRSVIDAHLDDDAFERLKNGPDLRIYLTRQPRILGHRSTIALAVLTHALNRRELRVHATWGHRFGFQPEVVSIRSCETRDELADLILHSSCTPPIFPVYRRGDRIVLDGGLIDNAPAHVLAPARSILILLTRRYPLHRLPNRPGRTYLQPSVPIPIVEWDYTSPAGIQQTFDIGRRDGEAFVARFLESEGELPNEETA